MKEDGDRPQKVILQPLPREVASFSGRGEIYSFTIIRHFAAPERFFDNAPYVVALIKLEEGPLVSAMITDVEFILDEEGHLTPVIKTDAGITKIEIGTPVESVMRRLFEDGSQGLIVYGVKFRPILGES